MQQKIVDGDITTKKPKPHKFTSDMTAKKRTRFEKIIIAIHESPGCSQKHIVEKTRSYPNTVSSDVVALERRLLVKVDRSAGRFKPYEHRLSKAGETYVKNLKKTGLTTKSAGSPRLQSGEECVPML